MRPEHRGACEAFGQLLEVMQRLLAPEGCLWDREQTLQSLKRYLIEEAYEVVDAIDRNDAAEHKEELGDVLFQIVFQSALRQQEGTFSIEQVCLDLAEKMRRRHPHIFADTVVHDVQEVAANWEKIKQTERSQAGKQRATLEGIPQSMPALAAAQKIGERAASVGFDWPDVVGIQQKLREEVAELDEAIARGDSRAIAHELGDTLLVLTRLASKLGIQAEEALRTTNQRFVQRFHTMQQCAERDGHIFRELPLEQQNVYWDEAKRIESISTHSAGSEENA